MSIVSFQECFDDLLENFSERFDATFRNYFDLSYPHEIPGLQDCGSSELLYQANLREYFDRREKWADLVDKESVALVEAAKSFDAQDVLDELVHDTCFKRASQEINSQPESIEENIRRQNEEMASDVNNDGVMSQVHYLIENGWQVKDIALKISESLDDQASPGMGR